MPVRSHKNRGQIVLAARQELEESGFAGFSLERVAIRCGRNKNVVYRHLGSRSKAIDIAWAEILKSRIAIYEDQPPLVSLAIEHWIKANAEQLTFFRLLAEESSLPERPALTEERRDYYRSQIASLATKLPNDDPEMAFMAILSMVSLPFVLPQVFELVTGNAPEGEHLVAYSNAIKELLRNLISPSYGNSNVTLNLTPG